MYTTTVQLSLLATGITLFSSASAQSLKKPNVILIVTDDQGYGDLGYTGNPHVRTPVIDQLARQSISFTNFYVSPVSAPTRSSLMTGRYSMRTGVRDTNNGGAIMATGEVTIAEMLKENGYKTGIFGKWHLGDNYPCRPMDQGFDESVVHLGGGMGQPGDITTYFKGDSSYFDPVLWHNGKQQKYAGYCSDIFAGQAADFISDNRNRPFFCYLAFNAPHTPLQVPEKYYLKYRDIDPSSGFKDDNRPFPVMDERDKEDARKVYAMVTNIDDNIGLLLKKLDELKLTENTIVIFMTDNGPQQRRYLAGMRGLKGSVYRGGVRVPFFLRYPALKIPPRTVDAISAHIDVLPTLAALCDAKIPSDRKIDGISLLPFMKGEKIQDDRMLFFYWTRRNPEKYNNIALMKGSYRLVANAGYDSDVIDFELFDVAKDPNERENIVSKNHEKAMILKAELDSMLMELSASENMVSPPYVQAGTRFENPVILNRNDAGGERGVWEQEEAYGSWNVEITGGYYNLRFRFKNPVPAGGRMKIDLSSLTLQKKNENPDQLSIAMKNIYLPDGKCSFTPYYEVAGKRILPFWVEMERIR